MLELEAVHSTSAYVRRRDPPVCRPRQKKGVELAVHRASDVPRLVIGDPNDFAKSLQSDR